MRKTHGIVLLALGFFGAAALAFAQNADKNTAAPTKNDLQLRVSEPAEGAVIQGSSVRVVVDYNRPIFGAGQGTRFGESTFPPAKFDVFLDDKLQQTLTSGENNVANIENVTPGAHKIQIVAKNISGEVIDRKVINITASEGTATASATTSGASAAPEPAPAPSSSYQSSQTAPAPPPAPASTAPEPAAPPAPSTLPQTGSSAPRLALAGLALALSGVLLSRKSA